MAVGEVDAAEVVEVAALPERPITVRVLNESRLGPEEEDEALLHAEVLCYLESMFSGYIQSVSDGIIWRFDRPREEGFDGGA